MFSRWRKKIKMPERSEKEKKSKFFTVLKVIIWLIVASFFLSILVSFFTGDDSESLNGNVAMIDISGPIITGKDTSYLFEDVTSSDDVTKLVRKANENDNIKAIVFVINSPGGSAVASDEIAAEIKKVNKTTVAWVREIGTSGAYWIASSTNHVIANRMSITGSIGVIASYLEFAGFIQEHNVTYERLVSGKYKDLGSPFKELTAEERAVFQKSLDRIHNYFVDEVAKNRKLNKKDVDKMATGAFYLGDEAKDLGLVDELGSRDEVISYLEKKLGQKVEFVKYKKPTGFFAALSQAMDEKSFFVGKGIGSTLFAQTEKPVTIST